MKSMKLSRPATYLAILLLIAEIVSVPYTAHLIVDYLRVSPDASVITTLLYTRIPASFNSCSIRLHHGLSISE